LAHEADGCFDPPAFAYLGAGTAAAVAVQTSKDMFRDVVGSPVSCSGDPGECLCQLKTIRRLVKMLDTAGKIFVKCKRSVLPSATSPVDIADCVTNPANALSIAADPKGKLAKRRGKLVATLQQYCDPPLPNDPFAGGECPGASGPTGADCFRDRVLCRACLMASGADDLGIDCSAWLGGSCCPLAQGRYTITYGVGGQLQVASIDGGTPGGFPFPAGGTIVQDVSASVLPSCVHDTVVPAAGGFSVPAFCIPGLNFTVQVAQNGCGVGQMDSNGGSDFTIVEVGDTSDSSATCNLPAVGCPPGPPSTVPADRDSSVRVDITVGDGAADTCGGGGTANAVVVIPVTTTTWLSGDFTCPDADGVFDAGSDTLILLINQNLDFTTDVSTSSWADIDGDGCSIAGAGPPAGLTRTGDCLTLGTGDVTLVGTGTIGSDGAPLFDLTFAARLPNTLIGPAPFGGATCGSPPAVDFDGTATRCIP
jgi:hypothetical protein